MHLRTQKPIVVAVSGGFDPVHVGHVRLFKEARSLGDRLIVILNNDNWLRKKKGAVFMPEEERKEVIGAIRYVDEVVLTRHPENPEDMGVSTELEKIRPDIFANGGDRTRGNIPEGAVCNRIACRMIFGLGEGGKVQSSSWLLSKFLKSHLCDCGSGKLSRNCCELKSSEV